MHPWDDPAQAPPGYDRMLESPHPAVSPYGAADFYDYQDQLFLMHRMQADQYLRMTEQQDLGRSNVPSAENEGNDSAFLLLLLDE